MRTNFKQRKKISYWTFLSIILVIIFLLAIRLFFYFGLKISPKLYQTANISIDKFTNNIIANFKSFQGFSDEEMNNIFKVQKNNQNEILSVDYNMKQTYIIAQTLTDNIKNEIKNLELGKTNIEYFDKMMSDGKSFILMMPLGLSSNNPFLNNLGPKIPVKVSFVESLFTNINTRVTDYGFNNALLEIFLEVKLQYEIIIPNTQTERTHFDFETLIGAKVINGRVPEYYGGIMNSKSNVATSSFR